MLYFLLIVAMAISIFATINVNNTYSKYSRISNNRGLSSEQVAEYILRSNGIFDVRIERIKGRLTDHYDPINKVLRLSDSVYGKKSMAAIGVAAHECGHAIQDATDYSALRIRHTLVPITNFCSRISMLVIMLGLFLEMIGLINLGIILYSVIVLFHLITLPVEFNASNRACDILVQSGYFDKSEITCSRKVLNAAAMTYVASTLIAIMQLIRLIAATRD